MLPLLTASCTSRQPCDRLPGFHASCASAQGSIPYVPVLRAPFYVWVGHPRPGASGRAEARVEAPPCFPPTFLYTQSWEDPRADMQVGCELIIVESC